MYDIWTRYDRSPPVIMAGDAAALELAPFLDGFESGSTDDWSSTAP